MRHQEKSWVENRSFGNLWSDQSIHSCTAATLTRMAATRILLYFSLKITRCGMENSGSPRLPEILARRYFYHYAIFSSPESLRRSDTDLKKSHAQQHRNWECVSLFFGLKMLTQEIDSSAERGMPVRQRSRRPREGPISVIYEEGSANDDA